MEYGANFIKPSEMWKDIKPKIGEMLMVVNNIETQAKKAQEEAYKRGYDDAKHECTDCQKIMTDAEQERVDKAYQQGVNDAENRRATCEFCEYAGNDESDEPCVSCCCGYMNRFRPKKEEIQIGDEVKSIERGWTAVVVRISDDDSLTLMDSNGAIADAYNITMFAKTGRHFPEITEVLQKMKEDDG